MSEPIEPSFDVPDLSLTEDPCLRKAVLPMIDGQDIQQAECPLRRRGYEEASRELWGSAEIALACAAGNCAVMAILQQRGGKVRVKEISP